MVKKSKGFGESAKKHQIAKLIGDDHIFWRVPHDKQPIIERNYDEQEKRISEIIGQDEDQDVLGVNEKTLEIYGNYLKEHLEYPCYLTGMEDFSWEESYVFGYMSKQEHNRLRQKHPSYLDTYKLIELIVDLQRWSEIGAFVQRMEDGKKFEISLSWLEATDRRSKNYQLLDDYACWVVNYQ